MRLIVALGILQLSSLVARAGSSDAIFHPEKDIRLGAIQKIGELGDKSKGFIPVLMKALSVDREPLNRSAILKSLVAIDSSDPRVYKAVVISLDDVAIGVQGDATLLLREKYGQSPVRDVILNKDKPFIAIRTLPACAIVIQKIGDLGDKGKDYIPVLIKALSVDRTSLNRRAILKSLVAIDSADPRVYKTVLASLEDTLVDDVSSVHSQAIFLLWDKFGDRPVRDLTTIFNNKKASVFVRSNAACALSGVLDNHVKGEIPRYVIDCLEGNMFDTDELIRVEAADIISKIAEARPEQAPIATIVKAFTTDKSIRNTLSNALRSCGKSAFPYLKNTIRHKDEDVRLMTLEILQFIGNDARSLLPEIRTCLADPSEKVRERAKEALAALTNP